MSEVSNLNTQHFNVEIKGTPFDFTVTRDIYNKFMNQTGGPSKVAPFHNFLMSAVDDKQRATLKQILADNPGSEFSVGTDIIHEYTPDLGTVVKKSSSVQSD